MIEQSEIGRVAPSMAIDERCSTDVLAALAQPTWTRRRPSRRLGPVVESGLWVRALHVRQSAPWGNSDWPIDRQEEDLADGLEPCR